MREYNSFVTIAVCGLYTLLVGILGAVDTISCVTIKNVVCAGTDRIVTTPELLALFALPLAGIAIVHVIWYGRSQ